ncbi:MAG TPA: secretin N-terminal domain-containing protein, partial [Verrucomicrobiae bacterium]
MNPDQPSREQIEARITALLLGDLPADEAELLRWTISQDAELQKLHGRLLLTVGLVREVVAHPEEASAEKAVPRNLSDERRQKLLAYFKTLRPAPKPLFWLKRIEVRPLVTALALVVLLGLLAVMVIPKIAGRSERARITAAKSDVVKQKELEEKFRAEGNAPANTRHVIVGLAPATPQPVPPPPAVTLTVAPPPPKTEIVLPQVQESASGVPAQSAYLAAASPAPADAETEIRVFPLKHASPTELAKEVSSVFPKPSQQNGQNGQAVNAVADPRTQSIIVTAPKDLMPEVSSLMDELDTPSTRDQKVAAFALQNSDPQQVAQVLQNSFANGDAVRGPASSSQNSALEQRAQNGVTTMGTTTTSGGIGGVSGVGGGGGG